MEGYNIEYIAIIGAVCFVWLFPILIIIGSSKTTAKEKIAWVLLVVFISWFAWIFYLLLAPLKPRESKKRANERSEPYIRF